MKRLDWLQPAVLTGSLLPLLVIPYRWASGDLGANPIATAMNQLGLLALLLLLASLACTPLKILLGIKWPMRLRKTLGLVAFFTVLLHLLLYLVLDQQLAMPVIVEDVTQRPFIMVGFVAFVSLIPLAVTSTNRALKRLGPKRWKRLHRLAYAAGVLGVLHYLLRVKRDLNEPIIYGAVLAFLLSVRAVDAVRRRHQRP